MLILIHSSCNKDENNEPGSVPGTWKMTSLHVDDGISTTTALGQEITYTYKIHGKDYDTSTTFTENPNEFSSSGSYTSVLILELLGQKDTTETVITAAPGTGMWFVNGNTLTQIFYGDTTKFDILEFTNSKLSLKKTFDVTFDDNGTTVRDQGTLFSIFEKE
jgi:hypothetical protein